jgi:hypothetical protein
LKDNNDKPGVFTKSWGYTIYFRTLTPSASDIKAGTPTDTTMPFTFKGTYTDYKVVDTNNSNMEVPTTSSTTSVYLTNKTTNTFTFNGLTIGTNYSNYQIWLYDDNTKDYNTTDYHYPIPNFSTTDPVKLDTVTSSVNSITMNFTVNKALTLNITFSSFSGTAILDVASTYTFPVKCSATFFSGVGINYYSNILLNGISTLLNNSTPLTSGTYFVADTLYNFTIKPSIGNTITSSIYTKPLVSTIGWGAATSYYNYIFTSNTSIDFPVYIYGHFLKVKVYKDGSLYTGDNSEGIYSSTVDSNGRIFIFVTLKSISNASNSFSIKAVPWDRTTNDYNTDYNLTQILTTTLYAPPSLTINSFYRYTSNGYANEVAVDFIFTNGKYAYFKIKDKLDYSNTIDGFVSRTDTPPIIFLNRPDAEYLLEYALSDNNTTPPTNLTAYTNNNVIIATSLLIINSITFTFVDSGGYKNYNVNYTISSNLTNAWYIDFQVMYYIYDTLDDAFKIVRQYNYKNSVWSYPGYYSYAGNPATQALSPGTGSCNIIIPDLGGTNHIIYTFGRTQSGNVIPNTDYRYGFIS